MPTTSKTKQAPPAAGPARRAEATINEQVRQHFDDFMESASVADRQFLKDVFELWGMNSCATDGGLEIAAAFENTIANTDVRVLTAEEWQQTSREISELRKYRQKVVVMPTTTAYVS